MPIDLGNGLSFHTRGDVGLPVNTAPTLEPHQQLDIIYHYTTGKTLGVDDPGQWTRNIEHHHRVVNGWSNGYAYNFGVACDVDPNRAHIIEGRGWLRQGGHTLHHNNMLGVVFYGSDVPGVNDVTPGALRALRYLLDMHRMVLHDAGLTQRDVLGHRDKVSTACPGNEIYDLLTRGFPAEPYVGRPGAVSLPTPPEPVPPQEKGEPGWVYDRPKPTLRHGSYGIEVVHLQRCLNLFSAGLMDDGILGMRTARGVLNFQRFWNLTADAIYGPITARTLDWAMAQIGR